MFSFTQLLVLSSCVAAALASSSSTESAATVYLRGESTWSVAKGFDPKGVAWGTFQDGLQSTGWGVLNIETNPVFSDQNQAFAAGVAEGFLTSEQIHNTFLNLAPNVFGNTSAPSSAVQAFLNDQEAFLVKSVEEAKGTDPFWRQANYVYQQYLGLAFGYEEAVERGAAKSLPSFAFQMLNGVGDLFDIIPACDEEKRIDWMRLNQAEAEDLHQKQGHCSGLIKVTGDMSDLFMAHSSWYTYSNMNRIFKHYNLQFKDESTKSRKISFSSYPGFLESLDDFYLLESGLTWTQTSNGVIDHSIYKNVVPQSLLAWQRVRIASAMSGTGEEWYENFRRYHSGTYANQYMVVNMNLFEPEKPLVNGTLWVVEEAPGIIVGADMTEQIRMGYWGSFNVPFFESVYDWMGYPAMRQKFGNYFTHDLCPRAQIFRRDQGKVVDLDSLKLQMRYNNFKNDPYSIDTTGNPNPMYAICSRGDLKPTNPSAGGCYDTKVTSYKNGAKDLRAQALNGPTSKYSGGELPPFEFTGPFNKNQHFGLPTKFDFDFISVEPQSPKKDYE